jgi:glycosyltransferase involved in cell wall biosynthesis
VKVVIITAGQPCAQPRTVKEAIALKVVGFDVTVIYCPMSIWGDDFDKELIALNPDIKWIRAGAHPKENVRRYLITRVKRKIWHYLHKLIGNYFHSALRSLTLYSQDIERESIKHRADLFIGHNLGSIKAVVDCSRKYGSLSAFDFEDFHRGESIESSDHWKKAKEIEDEFVTFIQLFTASSPLISKQYSEIYKWINPTSIVNVFEKFECSTFVQSNIAQLKLFWFSQTVGKGRGLESLIAAIALTKIEKIELTLLGNCTEEIRSFFLGFATSKGLNGGQLIFKDVCSTKEIFITASQHHIGICSENQKTVNRDLCLTNKIFTYLASQNAIILTSTKAQTEFSLEFPNVGFVYGVDDSGQLKEVLLNYYYNRNLLNSHRKNAYQLAREKLNWEVESNKLVDFYSNALNNL